MDLASVVGDQSSVGAPKTGPNSSIRRLGIALFVLLFVEGILGVASVDSHPSGPSALLIAHVILGLGIVALALKSLSAANHFPRRAGCLATVFTIIAIVVTALTGAIFLVTGFRQGAVVDRVLGLVDLAGSVLMILWGSARGSKRDPTH